MKITIEGDNKAIKTLLKIIGGFVKTNKLTVKEEEKPLNTSTDAKKDKNKNNGQQL